jgi:hypothetical protein
MPNIPPMITHTPDAQPLYAAYTPLPSGRAINLTWTTNTPGTDYSTASITIPGITATSVVMASLTGGSYTDTNASWLMVHTTSANTITFKVYTQPATPATFEISWEVVKF